MLLRIEDTDRERSTDAAIAAILDGLSWLGLDWDGEPIHQFARAARHREVAEELVAAGKAYRAYDTPEELNEARAKARAEGRFARYDGRWRDRDPSEAPAGVAPVIRIKAPVDGETVIEDRVQGRVAFPNERPRRFHHPALRRHADLHARRRRRRSRHGRHPYHPRRRPPDQRRPPEDHLRRDGLDGAGDGAHPADPRAGRRQALQAPRRAGRRCLSRHGLSARGDAQLSRPPRLEPRRRRDHVARRR